MKIFKSYTFTWWQIAILKLSLLSIGAIIGVYGHDIFQSYIGLVSATALISTTYILYISIKQLIE